MPDVAVVTANFGGYDEPRGAVRQEGYEDADWFYFTEIDRQADLPEPWEGIGVGGVERELPRLAAKAYKLTPWAIFDEAQITSDYRWIVWLDANMEVTSPRFLWEALADAACGGQPLTAMAHPRRTTVAQEVQGSFDEAPRKYGVDPDNTSRRGRSRNRRALGVMGRKLKSQLAVYQEAGFPDDRGLYACGTLVWNMTHRDTRDLGYFWLKECEAYTIQDQVSLPVVAWQMGLDVGTFAIPQLEDREDGAFGNRWIRIWPHNRED